MKNQNIAGKPRPLARLSASRGLCATLVTALAAALVGFGLLFAGPAQAQSVLALVNNRPITTFDVQQRIRLAQVTQGRRLSSKAALQELVDDQVKIIEASRVGYRITEEGVDAEFTRLAKNARQTDASFSEALRRTGLQPEMLRDSMRASLAWEALLRDRARRGSHVTRSELQTAVNEKRSGNATVTEFDLVQVLFIVPQGSGAAGERQRAANAARSRFTSCETGLDEFRTMKDVAVKDRVTRTSADLSKQTVALLAKTPVGHLTPPVPSPQGFELIAVCGKRERADPTADPSAVAATLTAKKFAETAKEYLESIRKKVDIRYMR
jgi:peptidyl-prolyl cis-trans isomerase SurA